MRRSNQNVRNIRFARGNYGLNVGLGRFNDNETYNNPKTRGLSGGEVPRASKLTMKDGSSNTLAVSELLTYPSPSDGSWGLWGYPGGATVSGRNTDANNNSWSAMSPAFRNNLDCTLFPNGDARRCREYTPHCPNGNGLYEFDCNDSDAAQSARSRHSGGVNVLLADGSVRFVTDRVNLFPWQAMFTANGGEAATLP
jgi:prepilin-type processing-associated H-X9-DG protein